MTLTPALSTNPARPIVLIVDDEPAVLAALSSLLAPRVEPLFRVETAASAEEALEIAAAAGATPLALVISDEKMPGRQGTELLTLLKQKAEHRHGGRIIITAYAGLPSARAAINEAEVDRYYPKPWDAENRLLPAVAEVLERFGERSGRDRFLLACPAAPARELSAIRDLRRAWWEYTALMGMTAEEAGVEAPSFEEPGDERALHVIAENISPRERYFVGALRALRPTDSGPWMLDGLALLPEAATPDVEALLVRTATLAAWERGPAEVRSEVPALRRELYESLGFAVVDESGDEPGPGTVVMALRANTAASPGAAGAPGAAPVTAPRAAPAAARGAPPATAPTPAPNPAPAIATPAATSATRATLLGPGDAYAARFRSEHRLCSCVQTACPAHDYALARRGYYCPLDLAEGRLPDGFPRRRA